MPVSTTLYLNDWDVARDNLVVEDIQGWSSVPTVADRVTKLPQRAGQVVLAPEAETAPRSISVSGTIKAPSLASLRSSVTDLKERLLRGTVEFRVVDYLDRMVLARVTSADVQGPGPRFANPFQRFAFTLMCPDPLIYAYTMSCVAFNATRARVPLGSAPIAPLIRVMGPATNPVISYRDQGGTVQQTLGLTGTLLGTDYLEINCELFQITKYTSGVASNAITWVSSGDFILLDPQDGDYNGSSWPTLEISAGAGEAFFRRAWL